MIYTSNFAQIRNMPDNIVPVAICRSVPEWYQGFIYFKLAPTYALLNHWQNYHDTTFYYEEYMKRLFNMNALETMLDISKIIGFDNRHKDVVLICYESADKVCHRHWVRDWLNSNGIPCKEWSKNG